MTTYNQMCKNRAAWDIAIAQAKKTIVDRDDIFENCEPLMKDIEVRIKYWCQETIESGVWCETGLMTINNAEKIIDSELYEMATIVKDEDGWPSYYA